MSLTDDEYEDAYHEALHCLAEALSVGEPFTGPSGQRLCQVEGRALGDLEVLERWWGKEIAAKIIGRE